MDFHKDHALIERAKQGDEEAFTMLYEKYYSSMILTAYRLTNNRDDAKDAVQNAFIQMHKSIHNLKEPKYFRLWMNKIVRGKCIDLFHKNRDMILDTGKDEIANQFKEEHPSYIPEEQFKFDTDRIILMKLIGQLSYPYQEVLIYAYLSQFSMQEIAELLDIPIGTVKSRLHSAKKALRAKVDDYESFHHYKITFHLPGGMSIALLLGYANARKQLHTSFNWTSIPMIQAMKLMGCTLLACGGIGAVAQYEQSKSNQTTQNLQTNTMHELNEFTEQEAYFLLMDWAFDDVQMSEKTTEELQEILPVYTYLKEAQGPFWERIKEEKWDIAYENLINN